MTSQNHNLIAADDESEDLMPGFDPNEYQAQREAAAADPESDAHARERAQDEKTAQLG
ncbi:hypothetical protein [Variovorax boronicumulans]|uniref:hypothetical protein n=1 Tax=Variovorax boronicumulans TaxID=436515 RepID=UPI0033945B86